MIGEISLVGPTITATLASWIVQRVADEDTATQAATAAQIDELQAEIRLLTNEVWAHRWARRRSSTHTSRVGGCSSPTVRGIRSATPRPPRLHPELATIRFDSIREDVCHRHAVLGVQAPGYERAVARPRIALDAEEGGHRVARKLRHDSAEVEWVEDLTGVALGVLGRERDAVALSHAQAVVLAVLELAQLGRRR